MGPQEEWHTISDSFLLLQKIGEALRQSPTHTVVVRYDPGLCAEISGVHFWTCSYTWTLLFRAVATGWFNSWPSSNAEFNALSYKRHYCPVPVYGHFSFKYTETWPPQVRFQCQYIIFTLKILGYRIHEYQSSKMLGRSLLVDKMRIVKGVDRETALGNGTQSILLFAEG